MKDRPGPLHQRTKRHDDRYKHELTRTQTGWRVPKVFWTRRRRQVKYKIKRAEFPHKTPKSAHWLAMFWTIICGPNRQSFPPISTVLQHARYTSKVVQTYSFRPWALTPLGPGTRRQRVTRSNQIAGGLKIITTSSYPHWDSTLGPFASDVDSSFMWMLGNLLWNLGIMGQQCFLQQSENAHWNQIMEKLSDLPSFRTWLFLLSTLRRFQCWYHTTCATLRTVLLLLSVETITDSMPVPRV